MERRSTQTVGKPLKAFFDDVNVDGVAPLFVWELKMAERMASSSRTGRESQGAELGRM